MATVIYFHANSWTGTEVTSGSVQHWKGNKNWLLSLPGGKLTDQEDVEIVFTLDNDYSLRHFDNGFDARMPFLGCKNLKIRAEPGVKLLAGRGNLNMIDSTVGPIIQRSSGAVFSTAVAPVWGLDQSLVQGLIQASSDPEDGGAGEAYWLSQDIGLHLKRSSDNVLFVKAPKGGIVPSSGFHLSWAEVSFRFDDCEDVTIEDLDLRGGTRVFLFNDQGRNLKTRGFTVRRCSFQGIQGAVFEDITTDGVPGDWLIEDNIFRWCGQGTHPSLQSQVTAQNKQIIVRRNLYEYIGHHIDASNDRHCINTEQGLDIQVYDNIFRYVCNAITIDIYRELILNVDIYNNLFEDLTYLGETYLESPGTISNLDLYGVQIEGNQNYINTEKILVKIRNNIFRRCGYSGIRGNAFGVDNDNPKVLIDGNEFDSCPAGIIFLNGNPSTQWISGIQGASIKGNIFRHCPFPIVWHQNGASGTENTDANRHDLHNFYIHENVFEGANIEFRRGAVNSMGPVHPSLGSYANLQRHTQEDIDILTQGGVNKFRKYG